MSDVLFETDDFFVKRADIENRGYEVYKKGISCATRCAVIGHLGMRGFAKACTEANKRQINLNKGMIGLRDEKEI